MIGLSSILEKNNDVLKMYRTFDFPKPTFILPHFYSTNGNSWIFIPA